MIGWLKKRWGLALSLVFYVFIVMFAAMSLAGLLMVVLHQTGVITLGLDFVERDIHAFRILFNMIVFSIFIGTALAAFFSKKALQSIRKLIEATKKVAAGDFNVSVESKGIYELEELARSFNQMTRELASIETLRSDFINNYSHEFKTPIVSIRGFAKLLLEGNLTEAEQQEYLKIIMAESERLVKLSSNTLNLSRYEAIEIITEKKPFHLDEQVRLAILLTEPKWAEKEINIDVKLDSAVYNGNEDLTQQIWLNLLDNAVKFTGQNGNICISLLDQQDSIHFIIKDDGIGMDAETIKHIFDKFYQGDKSHTREGNGLGLAITKRIIELCGGKITAGGDPGQGSAFTVVLPK
ncbi:MAG: HAMP domain-containing histidine kinase [Defluviitaleaceae bacterium]|nr:HAMP domain-containing histidine kinase [Defluviitaleaceae bacterium]